jgi:hypothetical protein
MGEEAERPVLAISDGLSHQRGEVLYPLQHVGMSAQYLHHLVLRAETDRFGPQSR